MKMMRLCRYYFFYKTTDVWKKIIFHIKILNIKKNPPLIIFNCKHLIDKHLNRSMSNKIHEKFFK